MVYRRTERVQKRLDARHAALIAAARALASEHGMEAVQVAPVAARADIAAGTVYRYFTSKTALVEALVADVSAAELAAIRAAAQAAPGRLSGLAAAIVTFAARSLRQRRLIWALTAEPVDPESESARAAFRRALVAEFSARIVAAAEGGHIRDIEPALAAPALVSALLEGLVGPLAPEWSADPAKGREAVQTLALFVLRGLGIVDARARGLVVQSPLPDSGDDQIAVPETQ